MPKRIRSPYKMSGIDFGVGTGGAYSTTDGKLYSGTGHGGSIASGALGNPKDVYMGRLNEEGTGQKIFSPYSSDAYDQEKGTALVHGKTMNTNTQKALYGTSDKPKAKTNTGGGGGVSDAKRGNKDLSKPTFGNALEEFQGGDLTRRQKRLIKKGRQDKARNIGSRRRRRTLKRGGEVSSSWQATKAPGKGNYKRANKVMSQDSKGKKKKTRLGEGGSYDFKGKNKAKGATGGVYDLRAARKARKAKRNQA